MRLPVCPRDHGSILIIVLWVALGLVSIALYFADSMGFEARAADNRLAAASAEQAIDGAARYVSAVLAAQATNGLVPEPGSYHAQSVPVGHAHFWLIGRSNDDPPQPGQVFFGLVDEGAKLNLNTVSVDMLQRLTNMTLQLAANIVDWRDTNGNVSTNGDGPTIYSRFEPPYLCKQAPFETEQELRLVYPVELGLLVGEDWNRNGTLDPNEFDTNRNNLADPGLLEYVTVYSREPVSAGGSARVNIRQLTAATLSSLLETNFAAARIAEITTQLGLSMGGGGGGGGGRPPGGGTGQTGGGAQVTIRSPLDFYRRSGMTLEEFGLVATNITVADGEAIAGRINVNTAPAPVLACLPGLDINLVETLVQYRRQNPTQLGTIAWLAEALGQNNAEALQALAQEDVITTESYQFTADIAALGPFGRGYKRVRFVFDMSEGTPRILMRQDLTHLGWALGTEVREQRDLARNAP